MTLTKMERLLLISSLQTLKAQLMGLKAQGVELPEDSPTVEGCDFSIAALESGFSIFYPHLQDAVGASFFEGDEMPHAECVFTLDVLEMFRRIIDYRGNNPDDDAAKSPTLSFMGFDGNCEGAYAALAKFAMERGGYCPELREKKIRTHAPMVERYRRMVKRWHASRDRARLTREDILGILEASGEETTRESIAREISHVA